MAEAFVIHNKVPSALTRILGVRISLSDSNPATRCTYTDDLEGYSPASWTADANGVISSTNPVLSKIREICNFRTCHILEGSTAVYKYLNPDDWRYYEDGSSAVTNMTNGSYNTFLEVPHFWLSIVKDDSYLYIRISNRQVDNTYFDWPFSYNGTVRKAHYIGSFLGYVSSGKLYSRADVSPTVSTPMSNFRTYSRAQGSGYDMWMFSSLTIMQVLYLLAFCNTNSQSAVSAGYTGGSALQTTGYSYNSAYGEFYRSGTGNTSRFRIFGVEDLWGNLYEYCSNIYTVSDVLYVTDYNTGDQAGSVLASKTFGSNYSGYVQTVIGETYFPFVAAEGGVSGSDTTYYCDYGAVGGVSVAFSGGFWSDGADAGVFRLNVTAIPTGHNIYGSRLVFLCPGNYEEAA